MRGLRVAEQRFQNLSPDDRRDALEVAKRNGSLRAHLLEKDVWVVATLGVLFNAPFAEHLTFKGGTSLSKVWQVIRRFSEDVDITYDIRAFAPDLVSGAGEDALPPTRSQEKRWTRAIRARLAEWIRYQARPTVKEALYKLGFVARCRVEAERLHVAYEPMFETGGFVTPEIIVEFGARSTGEPHVNRPVICDAAAFLPGIAFPEARPTVMLAERTFWEKATAIHVFCRQQRRRGERLSRHWHDLSRLDEAGIAAQALADRALGLSVARHKAMFFAKSDACGERIDYNAAVSGHLQPVPEGARRAVLADDYAKMLADGMLLDENEPFDTLIERCAQIEVRANTAEMRDH